MEKTKGSLSMQKEPVTQRKSTTELREKQKNKRVGKKNSLGWGAKTWNFDTKKTSGLPENSTTKKKKKSSREGNPARYQANSGGEQKEKPIGNGLRGADGCREKMEAHQ